MTKYSKDTTSFFERVYEVVRLIPYGKASSYGDIANYIGTGKSARMVGWAMNASGKVLPPVPAHRVVNRIGMLTGKGHFENPNLMKKLLESEGIKVVKDQIVDFEKIRWQPLLELES